MVVMGVMWSYYGPCGNDIGNPDLKTANLKRVTFLPPL